MVGSVVVIEDIGNCDITVKAECEEIGYKAIQEHVEINKIKTMICNMKKFIKEELEKNRGCKINKIKKSRRMKENKKNGPRKMGRRNR